MSHRNIFLCNIKLSLLINNNTSEDKLIRLFDCSDLFNSEPSYFGIEIKNSIGDLSYTEVLVRLLSQFNEFIFNYVILFSQGNEEPSDTVISHISKGILGNTELRNIRLFKHKDQEQTNCIASHEQIFKCVIKNGKYVEYLSKANTKVLINFINKVD